MPYNEIARGSRVTLNSDRTTTPTIWTVTARHGDYVSLRAGKVIKTYIHAGTVSLAPTGGVGANEAHVPVCRKRGE